MSSDIISGDIINPVGVNTESGSFLDTAWRKTTQNLAPADPAHSPQGQYNIYPGFPLGGGKITRGFDALAGRLAGSPQVVVEGYGGVLWNRFRGGLDAAFRRQGVRAHWVSTDEALRPEAHIEALVNPFLGGEDPLFGTRFTGKLADFYDLERLRALHPDTESDVSLLYGCGAALAGWDGPLVYVDVPKNEIQFRARAGSICNLGCRAPDDPKQMYKRFYFVDWVVLNQHKADLLPRIDVIVDSQRPKDVTSASGSDLRSALAAMSHSFFRVRPWFEPGPWGGQWIKEHVSQLPQDAPNYAWSFELIVPENGLAVESDGLLLEVSFDFLMFFDARAVVGNGVERFGYEFPIRFDLLDTFAGGNLSVQCHPHPEYASRHFGETFTQDETYYILDCKPDAYVYLGFHEDINPAEFRSALERSFEQALPMDVDQFVKRIPAQRGDLFLIPHGTIHCSGADNLVLEISATPYIFTFKMYDWMRLNLDGLPRPLNIDRAFENLYFERRGERVREELISHPTVLAEGDGWRQLHLPTHPDHFYDVHRLEFCGEMVVPTDGSCQVMSLVEGHTVVLEAGGRRQRFSFAETFVVPAAAGQFRLICETEEPVKVIQAFLKPCA